MEAIDFTNRVTRGNVTEELVCGLRRGRRWCERQQVPLRFAFRNDKDALGFGMTTRLRDRRDDERLGQGTLEGDGDAAADGAGSLNQIEGLAVLTHHGDIALGQQVAQIDERFHVGGPNPS